MKYVIALVILAFPGSSAFTQGNTGPANAMLSYADAAKSWDAERITQLMHPEALRQARAAFDGALLGENQARARTELLPMFSVATYEEFSKLSDFEVFQRLNEAVATSAPEILDLMAGARYEIIAETERGDEVILNYVLIINANGQEIRQDVVQRLKQHEGDWLLLLPATAASTIAGIEARY
jgi:hypothetical protein